MIETGMAQRSRAIPVSIILLDYFSAAKEAFLRRDLDLSLLVKRVCHEILEPLQFPPDQRFLDAALRQNIGDDRVRLVENELIFPISHDKISAALPLTHRLTPG